MADLQHISLTSSDVHEPKHISNSNLLDTGKVITPSSSTGGISVLRRLTTDDMDFALHYGEMVVSNNATPLVVPMSADLSAPDDYLIVTGIWQAGITNDITYLSGTLTVPDDGIYMATNWLSLTSNVAMATAAFKSVVNGTIEPDPLHAPQYLTDANKVYNLAATGLVQLDKDDNYTVAIGSDVAGNFTISNAKIALVQIASL